MSISYCVVLLLRISVFFKVLNFDELKHYDSFLSFASMFENNGFFHGWVNDETSVPSCFFVTLASG